MIAFSEFAALATYCGAMSCEAVIKDSRGQLRRAEWEQNGVSNDDLNWIANFIWNIADDVLRDLYVRGKYRDVILPMTVLRRLDAVLEPTKKAVIEMKAALDQAKITNQDHALRQAAGQAFYNTSHLPSAICVRGPASSNSGPISKPISTASLRMSRRSLTASSSAIRSRDYREPTR
jgi:hypothetical protein